MAPSDERGAMFGLLSHSDFRGQPLRPRAPGKAFHTVVTLGVSAATCLALHENRGGQGVS
jgi:hypothetical protein